MIHDQWLIEIKLTWFHWLCFRLHPLENSLITSTTLVHIKFKYPQPQLARCDEQTKATTVSVWFFWFTSLNSSNEDVQRWQGPLPWAAADVVSAPCTEGRSRLQWGANQLSILLLKGAASAETCLKKELKSNHYHIPFHQKASRIKNRSKSFNLPRQWNLFKGWLCANVAGWNQGEITTRGDATNCNTDVSGWT